VGSRNRARQALECRTRPTSDTYVPAPADGRISVSALRPPVMPSATHDRRPV